MERKWIIGLIIIALILGILLNFESIDSNHSPKGIGNNSSIIQTNQGSNIAGPVSNQIMMTATMPKGPEKILVYKTLPPSVNKDLTLDLAKKFNISGNLYGETTIQSDDRKDNLIITKKTGSIEFFNQDRPNDIEDSPDILPSDEMAEKIATEFLKERNLLPEGTSFDHIKREYSQGVDSNGKITYYSGQIGVWYKRTLNGITIEGTQFVIYLGGKGDVIGFYSNWRDYQPYKEMSVKTPDTAFIDLKTKGVPSELIDRGTVSIDNAYLAYYTKAGAFTEEYLEPVWVFKGQIMADGKPVKTVEEYIPALTDEAVKSLSPP